MQIQTFAADALAKEEEKYRILLAGFLTEHHSNSIDKPCVLEQIHGQKFQLESLLNLVSHERSRPGLYLPNILSKSRT